MLDNTLLCESCVLHFLPVYSVSVTLSPFKVSVESKILDFNSEIYSSSLFFKKLSIWRRSQDGGGIGRRDHFLFYKFIERTTER